MHRLLYQYLCQRRIHRMQYQLLLLFWNYQDNAWCHQYWSVSCTASHSCTLRSNQSLHWVFLVWFESWKGQTMKTKKTNLPHCFQHCRRFFFSRCFCFGCAAFFWLGFSKDCHYHSEERTRKNQSCRVDPVGWSCPYQLVRVAVVVERNKNNTR